MSGSLQTKVYGGHRHSSTILKKAGHYNNAPVKRLGFYNGAVKRLGVYNGVGGSKHNITGEIYPHQGHY